MKYLTSTQHPIIKHLVKLKDHRSYRYEVQRVVIEGRKMIHEICSKHPAITLIIEESCVPLTGVITQETIIVSKQVMKKISGTQSPEGYIAEVSIPTPLSNFDGIQRMLVLDGVNEPGNMGTLIRTGLALGWEAVFIVSGSCDPFNDKALRSGKGATFRLPMRIGNWEELKVIVQEIGMIAYLADIGGEDLRSVTFSQSTPLILVMGNEAHGASEEAKELCRKIKIPMFGEMESLNVATAGGIMMYEMVKSVL